MKSRIFSIHVNVEKHFQIDFDRNSSIGTVESENHYFEKNMRLQDSIPMSYIISRVQRECLHPWKVCKRGMWVNSGDENSLLTLAKYNILYILWLKNVISIFKTLTLNVSSECDCVVEVSMYWKCVSRFQIHVKTWLTLYVDVNMYVFHDLTFIRKHESCFYIKIW